MKALFIGSDPSLFNPESGSFARIRSYAQVIGSVVVLMRSGEDSSLTDGPLTVQGVKGGKLRGIQNLARVGHELILSEGIDVVSAQDPFEHGWAAKEAVKGTNAKLHIQVHTDFLSPWFTRGGIFRSPQVSMPFKNRVRQLVADQVLPKAHGIRVVSERVKESLQKRYNSRIPEPTVIPIAVGTEVPPPAELPRHSFSFALISVGRLEPEKRIEDLLEVVSKLKDRYPVGLILVGEGRERARLMTLVLEKNLTGSVVFAGERSDAWGMMQNAQAYIQASGYEGYGRTLVEAALARVPIITTDVGIVGEVFKGYEDVLATPPGDPTNLAYHVIALIQDAQARELMVRSAETKAKVHLEKYKNLPEMIAQDLARLVAPHA